jgi:hypothetical protein
MVEKSKKKPFCDPKYGKNRVFVGDRLREPKRETSIIKDLRATQATRQNARAIDKVDLEKIESVGLAGCTP